MIERKSNTLEFLHENSYLRFAHNVLRSRRYVLTNEDRQFLDTVLATLPNKTRDGIFPKGKLFYRAQIGVDFCEVVDRENNYHETETLGYNATRMKPQVDRAREGRANPTGIPCLYVATTINTAVSEVRPWIGAEVSVATCRVNTELRGLDLSVGHGNNTRNLSLSATAKGRPPTKEEKRESVWRDIDNAFSRPVTSSDDQAHYAPTQILSELFQEAGYDALIYKSQFGNNDRLSGYNIAIFNPDLVDIVQCAPYKIQSISVVSEQSGSDWYRKSE